MWWIQNVSIRSNTHVFDYKYDIPIVVSLTTYKINDQNEINTEQKKKLRG